MGRAVNKANRILKIEAMLLDHPEGMTQAEIARRLGVHRSTINRYLPDLPGHIYIDDLDGNKWKIDREAYLVRVRLNLHEALAVHIASRLMSTRMDRHNPHAAAAMRKLAVALERLAPRISHHLGQSADVMDGAEQQQDPVYLEALEKLTLAWAEERKTKVWHRYKETGEVYEYIFSPYFIEPYAVGQTTHVIGFREPPGAIRTFKIERIERVKLLDERYAIPEEFDPLDLLADAWGIWYTSEEPVEIILRFHPSVAGRVQETRWHPSEKIEKQSDGSLIWRVRIGEYQEILPWIRGWGADCEVLEPEGLRKELQREATRLYKVYAREDLHKLPDHFHLWAKTDRKTKQIHPLIYHMIDVGQVSLALWENAFNQKIRQDISSMCNLNPDETGRLVGFLAAMHDLGKASPAFQDHPALPDSFKAMLLPPLKEAGLVFPKRGGERRARHEVISTWALESLLVTEIGMDKFTARKIAQSLGGHHGTWPTEQQLGPFNLKSDDKGEETWDAVRLELTEEIKNVFSPPEGVRWLDEQIVENTLLTILSGLTSTADWIGSMEEFFPYEENYLHPAEYAKLSAEYAYESLEKIGWLGWRPSSVQMPFNEMFNFAPNSIQKKVIDSDKEISHPCLMILEAPTGIGKTEAAFYMADRWLQSRGGSGIYIAMPTQATSNQMFDRTVKFLINRYSDQWINIHLVHGQAQFSDKMQALQMKAIAPDTDDKNSGQVAAMTWFLPRKRTLLASFGVGTVDQALMSVLQTKHFFVRLFALYQKVVIFDEVHAYDTYMSALFQRLLSWLGAMGASVIILSATLPESTRKELAAAYLGKRPINLPAASLPRLTVVNGQGTQSISLPATEDRNISLEWLGLDAKDIAAFLKSELHGGGCAAVICNRVAHAQEVYQAIREAKVTDTENLILFHARFPVVWRNEIEKKVLDRFGKDSERPHKAIIVGTQVIEQSLDLDFDLMVSDLAPIDLLIQRGGRLHRHTKRNKSRPRKLSHPRLAIPTPAKSKDLPNFGNDVYVYEKFLLLQTWLVLQGKNTLALPSETSKLIELVYSEKPDLTGVDPALAAHLRATWDEMRMKQKRDDLEARKRMILKPTDEMLLDKAILGLDEEDPNIHQAFRAMTRLIEPGVSLVCLHQTEDGLALEPDGMGAQIDLYTKPSRELVRELVLRVVTVRRRDVLEYFQAQVAPKGWKEVAALRYHHAGIFEDGIWQLNGTNILLLLDRDTGLKIQKT